MWSARKRGRGWEEEAMVVSGDCGILGLGYGGRRDEWGSKLEQRLAAALCCMNFFKMASALPTPSIPWELQSALYPSKPYARSSFHNVNASKAGAKLDVCTPHNGSKILLMHASLTATLQGQRRDGIAQSMLSAASLGRKATSEFSRARAREEHDPYLCVTAPTGAKAQISWLPDSL